MIIERVEAIILDFPFQYGANSTDFIGPAPWRHLSTLLVRVETSAGVTGWGEAFSYACAEAVKAALEHMVAPSVIGRDAADIAGIARHCQQSLHLFGRYGITLFAISGLEIALWDIAGKVAGQPLHKLLGGASRERIPAYASLLRYGDPEWVAEHCKSAQDAGYAAVKLHETTEPAVRAARETLGDGVPLMIDVNCPWRPQEALAMARAFKAYEPTWLEEPVFPPEDHVGLARVRHQSGVSIAAGENHCTSFQFRDMFAAGAVDYAQPSVTKVGGIGELMKVAILAEAAAVSLMPHSPYFGPGWLATLHLMAAIPGSGYIERFYGTVEASTSGPWIAPQNGALAVPTGAGLGHDPEPELLREYQRRT
ncbi:MAG: mandelate racemase/muconate lactonizing enzyme family protein [Gammaproteobacteria bacterium]|nr:mandelate racemase/muconate lactonizing enzyme family protein [Gammaproteobacteria bacterium]